MPKRKDSKCCKGKPVLGEVHVLNCGCVYRIKPCNNHNMLKQIEKETAEFIDSHRANMKRTKKLKVGFGK